MPYTRADREETILRRWTLKGGYRLPTNAVVGRVISCQDTFGEAIWSTLPTLYAPPIDLTGQTGNASGTIASVAGAYLVLIYQACTQAGTAGLLTTVLSWTDSAGAMTGKAADDISLAELGRGFGALVLYLASGSLTYATTRTGVTGSPLWSLRLRALPLT